MVKLNQNNMTTFRKKRRNATLYLINDSVNTLDYVIEILNSFLPFVNKLRAEQIAVITHNTGECQIYHGRIQEASFIYGQLKSHGLTVELRA